MGLVTIDVDPGVKAGAKPIGFDELAAVNYQIVKLLIGAAGNFQLLDKDDPATPIPVRLTNGAAFYTASGGGGGSTPATDVTQVAVTVNSGGSVDLLAANANRLGAIVYNPLAVDLIINLEVAATLPLGVARIGPRGSWLCPFGYVGKITGIPASGSGDVTVTEFLP